MVPKPVTVAAGIQSLFETVDHDWPMRFLEHPIADQRILRLIPKWLTAGVLEEWRKSGGRVAEEWRKTGRRCT